MSFFKSVSVYDYFRKYYNSEEDFVALSRHVLGNCWTHYYYIKTKYNLIICLEWVGEENEYYLYYSYDMNLWPPKEETILSLQDASIVDPEFDKKLCWWTWKRLFNRTKHAFDIMIEYIDTKLIKNNGKY